MIKHQSRYHDFPWTPVETILAKHDQPRPPCAPPYPNLPDTTIRRILPEHSACRTALPGDPLDTRIRESARFTPHLTHWTEHAADADSHVDLERKLRDAAKPLREGASLKTPEYPPTILGQMKT